MWKSLQMGSSQTLKVSKNENVVIIYSSTNLYDFKYSAEHKDASNIAIDFSYSSILFSMAQVNGYRQYFPTFFKCFYSIQFLFFVSNRRENLIQVWTIWGWVNDDKHFFSYPFNLLKTHADKVY